jgi:hypothetical protein
VYCIMYGIWFYQSIKFMWTGNIFENMGDKCLLTCVHNINLRLIQHDDFCKYFSFTDLSQNVRNSLLIHFKLHI